MLIIDDNKQMSIKAGLSLIIVRSNKSPSAKMSNIVIILVSLGMLIVGSVFISCEELKLVTILFRHGDRTPDITTLYPLDPYINETYFPIGIGQLTNKGKHRAFALGQLLRQRYDLFLGDTYFPNLVEAVSTNMDRTKATLQLVLAGAFPIKNEDLDWNPLLKWQPIPYNYTSFEHDMWITFPFKYCPKYSKSYKEYINSPPGLSLLKSYSKLFNYLSTNTGTILMNPLKLWNLYTCLLSETEWGLALPEWAKSVFPDVLEKASLELLPTLVATTKLRQLSGGLMLKKIIKNMVAKMENKLVPEEKKIILYSGHDFNILFMSAVLDQVINQTIPYSSYYIFELTKSQDLHNVQIFRNDYTTQNITPVKIPGCDFVCPIGVFIELTKKYVSVDNNACWDLQ